MQLYAICLEEGMYYCLRCLEHLLKKEMQETQILEERYIYQKEYESFSEGELQHVPHEKDVPLVDEFVEGEI